MWRSLRLIIAVFKYLRNSCMESWNEIYFVPFQGKKNQWIELTLGTVMNYRKTNRSLWKATFLSWSCIQPIMSFEIFWLGGLNTRLLYMSIYNMCNIIYHIFIVWIVSSNNYERFHCLKSCFVFMNLTA